ncbi:uncharacterized protein LOC109831133 [Asparagus officinalis]|uniref:uncharacterized protein LOC109831133 n=1 Tax=Asparagus officinalis TaxID=4686 RepID=UPI00098E473B|nr:uncharacterized protein LOC109831133 [Asparagus officinalis]
MDPFAALYGKQCRSLLSWDDVGEREIFGPELIDRSVDAVRIIRERLRIAQDRFKHWADAKRRYLEFQPGDHLRKYVGNLRHVVDFSEIKVRSDLTYEKQPVEILDRREKTLHNKTVSLVRVMWHLDSPEELTWETEPEMLQQYPHLFPES